MRRLSTLVALCVLVAAVVRVSAQCDDPYDLTLCVHDLSPTQEDEFSATDGAVSPFWATLSGDYIELIPPDNCGPTANCNFTGVDDGSMIIKAAMTDAGVYIYAEVKDNVWVDWSGGDSYGDDSVDLYFDALSANEIFTCTDCLIGLYSSTLSYTTQQIQVYMGATAMPNSFRFAYYDELLWSWQTMILGWAEAEALYGFKAEAVTVDGATKAQEWFMPWSSFGGGIASLAADQDIGFAGGYNDMDGDNIEPDKLRWPIAGDPWAGDAQTVNYWGDMRVPRAVAVIPQSIRRAGQVARLGDREVKVAFYSLQGQRLSAETIRNLSPSAMVVRRARMANGSYQSRMVRVTR